MVITLYEPHKSAYKCHQKAVIMRLTWLQHFQKKTSENIIVLITNPTLNYIDKNNQG